MTGEKKKIWIAFIVDRQELSRENCYRVWIQLCFAYQWPLLELKITYSLFLLTDATSSVLVPHTTKDNTTNIHEKIMIKYFYVLCDDDDWINDWRKKNKTTTTNLGTYWSFVLLIGPRKQQNKQTQVWWTRPTWSLRTSTALHSNDKGASQDAVDLFNQFAHSFPFSSGGCCWRSRPQQRNQLMPPQSERRSSGVPPAPQQTWVSWEDSVLSFFGKSTGVWSGFLFKWPCRYLH